MTASDSRTLIQSAVERIERINEELKALNDHKRDLFQEFKSHGLDVKALKEVIRLRAKTPDERKHDDMTIALYAEALGIDLGRELKHGMSLDDLLYGVDGLYPSDSLRQAA